MRGVSVSSTITPFKVVFCAYRLIVRISVKRVNHPLTLIDFIKFILYITSIFVCIY